MEQFDLRECLWNVMSKDYNIKLSALTECLTDWMFLKRCFGLVIECLSTLFTSSFDKCHSRTMFANIVRLGVYLGYGSNNWGVWQHYGLLMRGTNLYPRERARENVFNCSENVVTKIFIIGTLPKIFWLIRSRTSRWVGL